MVEISKNFVNSESSRALSPYRLTQNLRSVNSLVKLVNSYGFGRLQDILNLKAYKRYGASEFNITEPTLTDFSSYLVALVLSLILITPCCITGLTNDGPSWVIVECF